MKALFEKKYNAGIILAVVELALYELIFMSGGKIDPTVGTKLLLIVLSVICPIFCVFSIKNGGEEIKKYMSPGRLAVLGLICVYAALASFGQRFFLDGNSRMHFDGMGLVYCLMLALWFVPVLGSILCLMELLAKKGGEKREKPGFKFYALVFLIYCCWEALVFLSFRPGGWAPDSISQLFQAIGYEKIYDWHPALHTLFFRLILRLTGNRAMMIVAVQLVAYAALTAGYVSLAAGLGCRKWLAALAGLIFLMLPNNVLSAVAAVKDTPYMLSLMWATLLILRLALDLKGECRLLTLAQLALAIFFVFGFRHNGVIPAAFIIALLLALSLRYKSAVGLRPAICAVAAAAMILIYKGPVFTYFDVQPNTATPYTTMLCAVGSCINKGLPLSEESTQIMESVIPLEDWAEFYDRYQGHDRYTWGRDEDEEFITTHIDGKMAFKVYLEALFKYPDVVIKDRLDGMDLMWDLRQPDDGFNAKSFDCVYLLPYSDFFFDVSGFDEIGYKQYARPSALAGFYRGFVNTPVNSAADMLLWRSGAYIILFMLFMLFIFANGTKCFVWAAVPMLGNMAGLTLLLYHQSFRYVYSFQGMALGLTLTAVLGRNVMRQAKQKRKDV